MRDERLIEVHRAKVNKTCARREVKISILWHENDIVCHSFCSIFIYYV